MRAVDLVALLVVLFALLLFFYAYFGYPLTLWILGRFTNRSVRTPDEVENWPSVSFSVPVFNEEHQIEDLIRSLLTIDYPRDRIQFLIVSDASSDRTDEIVRSFGGHGIELLTMPERGGKTKAEAAAAEHLEGEIVVNTDASIRIAPEALKPLIAALSDPEVGLASGRDISVGPNYRHGNTGESGYVGYEMRIRDLETRVSGIVGASGCFYAIRADLHRLPLPESLSRDFAAALHTIENGYRPVSVPEAICYVPRTMSLKKEYRRKVRTITRGMDTLSHKSSLLNPFRYGAAAWMLLSHKICRWGLPWAAVLAFLAIAVLAASFPLALAVFLGELAFIALAIIGWFRSNDAPTSKLFSIPAFLLFGNLAAMHAFIRHVRGDQNAIWEPTRREMTGG